jgi:hypothetical protein
MLVEGFDQNCRYLPAPGGSLDHGFGGFLREVGVRLPASPDLRQMVRHGWISPVLRVRLPETFYLGWENYPANPFLGTLAQEDRWANELYNRCAFPGVAARQGELSGDWFNHYLDDPADGLARQVRDHAIPAAPGAEEPAPLYHPHRETAIYPWIDFFGYWQVYELVELLRAARLFSPPLNEPGAEEALAATCRHLSDLRRLSDRGMQGIRDRWERNRPIFEWVSRYRTLLAIFADTDEDWSKVREAAPRLLADLAVTPPQLKEAIRNILLVEWQRLKPPGRGQEEIIPRLLGAHLQQDIERALSFLREVSDEEVELDDPFWGLPDDYMNRGWAPMPVALPYEALEARRAFPEQAPLYFRDLNPLLGPSPVDQARLRALMARRWSGSVPFRRFCLAFQRLHDHLRTDLDDKIGLRSQTPMEFLILCALATERILRDRHLARSTPPAKIPGVTRLITSAAGEVLRSLGISSPAPGLKELAEVLGRKGQLHDLHLNPRNPFVAMADFAWGDPLSKSLLVTFANFGILRNYAAHHDCLDDQFVYGSMALTAVKAVLVPTVMVIDL